MSEQVLIAVIASIPPAAAAVLGYLANRRALKRSVGTSPGVPLAKLMERMDARFEIRFDRLERKFDRVVEVDALTRERLAQLEAKSDAGRPR